MPILTLLNKLYFFIIPYIYEMSDLFSCAYTRSPFNALFASIIAAAAVDGALAYILVVI